MTTITPEPSGIAGGTIAPRPGMKRRRRGDASGGWPVAIWFLLPSLIGFVLFYLIPTIRAINISFQEFNLLTNSGESVGWENYSDLWGDDVFWNAVKVTSYYVVLNIGSQTILALGLAVMMDRLTKSLLVRGAVLLPWILPNVLVGLLFLFMLDGQVGIFNEMLAWFGVKPISFLANPDWVVPALALMNTWKFTGYTALLLFAGMQVIPGSLYEAGSLDGASEWAMFRTITMPLLRPVLALVMVVSLIGSFQVFDTVQAASGGLQGTPGQPLDSSRVLYLYIYENAFLFQRKFGYAAAIATVLMLFLMLMTILQLRLLRADQSDLA